MFLAMSCVWEKLPYVVRNGEVYTGTHGSHIAKTFLYVPSSVIQRQGVECKQIKRTKFKGEIQ